MIVENAKVKGAADRVRGTPNAAKPHGHWFVRGVRGVKAHRARVRMRDTHTCFSRAHTTYSSRAHVREYTPNTPYDPDTARFSGVRGTPNAQTLPLTRLGGWQ